MFPLKNFLAGLGLSGLILSFQIPTFALAVPDGVRQWVLEQDKLADIREDGWVKLSTGDEYILVQPAEIPTTSDTVKVTNITHIGGDETAQPDVVMFSNGYFLLHVIPLAGGEKTLPIWKMPPHS